MAPIRGAGRGDVEDDPAPDRSSPAGVADDEPIEHVEHERARGADPREPVVQHPDRRVDLRGARVHLERAPRRDPIQIADRGE